ncbi:hypothetical protein CYMTET_43264 [Cymbomonas tetramitiformis]|uniref:SET domain-containing protein n=1 Tax=Cymbomonas tetramitiformis TaxID=36881 RepID=A0AAE0F061_9CHLO|nr:hypothetical protein CYMTET_43264 [Cymbomonas tetramitiformis]
MAVETPMRFGTSVLHQVGSMTDKNVFLMPYDANGRLPAVRGPTPIMFEASEGPPQVCQLSRGIQIPLEVFRSGDERKGWGLRCLRKIHPWEFVCEYTGLVEASDPETEVQIPASEVRMETDEYVFDLNLSGGHSLADALDETEEGRAEALEESRRSGEPWMVQPSRKDALALLHAAGLTEEDGKLCFKLDAARAGNASRFVNHEPDEPNLFVQMVATPGAPNGAGSDPRSPRIALFAMREIPAMTELTFDYGAGYNSKFADGAMAKAPKRGGCA